MATAQRARAEVIYPDSDGMPMADSTRQWRGVATIKDDLNTLFQNDPDVLVAGNLLWYPIEGDNKTRMAPGTGAGRLRPAEGGIGAPTG